MPGRGSLPACSVPVSQLCNQLPPVLQVAFHDTIKQQLMLLPLLLLWWLPRSVALLPAEVRSQAVGWALAAYAAVGVLLPVTFSYISDQLVRQRYLAAKQLSCSQQRPEQHSHQQQS